MADLFMSLNGRQKEAVETSLDEYLQSIALFTNMDKEQKSIV